MTINECCKIDVVCCEAGTPIPEVAALMRAHHVGDIVVIENRDGMRFPVGIVTDRDLVVEIMAVQLDPKVFTAGDIMSAPVATVAEDEDAIETLRLMRSHKVRRLPAVTAAGALFGIVTADDLVSMLIAELSGMAGALVDQRSREAHLRR